MLKSIKSRTIFLTISILFILSAILICMLLIGYKNDKDLTIKGNSISITTFAEQLNKEVAKLESNALDLALMGEIYYKTGKSDNISRYLVKKVFTNYENSLGGGIWFEPYVINPTKKLSCVYGFHDDNGNVILDKAFETEAYNYLNKSWYKEIKPKLSDKNKVVWSKPYLEKEGSEALMTTVGAGIYDGNKLVGISTVDWEISSIVNTISKMKPTTNSFALLADINNDYVIVSTDKYIDSSTILGKSLKDIPWYKDDLKDGQELNYLGTVYVSYVQKIDDDMIFIINVPKHELLYKITKRCFAMLFWLLVTSLLIAQGVYYILKYNVTEPIDKLTDVAKEIGNGNLNAKAEITAPLEFAQLSQTFEQMTKDIKIYMHNLNKVTHEKEKMESELSIARAIQYSALPSENYDNSKEFDIAAYMDTAKEVGGDFYDFFFINPTQFMFLIADVSGKGIPAALFMMTTKTLIKNLAKENYSPKELIEKINNQICENNRQGFFVTLFACIVDITTGKVTFMNCGHNPPLLKHASGKFEYLKTHSNLVLGAYENFNYTVDEITMNKNDILLLYTDGVTEALNEHDELYGNQRLLECLNKPETENYSNIKTIITNVRTDVGEYSKNVEQSDDITMVVFKFNGINDGEKIVLPAKVEKFDEVNQWLISLCKRYQVSKDYLMKLQLIAEELFVNVASYAYPNGDGDIEISFNKMTDDVIGDEIILEFADSGVPYNPLEKPNPDITLNAQDRPIGGLGIFVVKKYVDSMEYNYKDGKNILTLKLLQK